MEEGCQLYLVDHCFSVSEVFWSSRFVGIAIFSGCVTLD